MVINSGKKIILIILGISLFIISIFSANLVLAIDYTAVEIEASKIGDMYNCPGHIRPNAYFILGNTGYSFIDDEMIYSYAKLLNEKGCHKEGDEKYVIFYVSTVNFPSDGVPTGVGSDIEQKWLDYWDYNAKRFSDLGYKIRIHPFPFIIKDSEQNLDYPPGLRPLVKSDLNLAQNEIPVVYECRDGGKTVLASIYDPKTLDMGIKFYEGIKNFFSKYSSFAKISIVPPSDFGEYGFPMGITVRWWEGGDNVYGCYKTGDIYARQIISGDTPSYNQYNGKLNEFRAALTSQIKSLFPNKKYLIYMGYGSETIASHGFSYEEVSNFAINNGIELHSSHARGLDYDSVILNKITKNKPEGYEISFENAGELNEYMQLKSFSQAAQYGITGLVLYPHYFYDYPYLAHLLYGMGPSANKNMYSNKGIIFNDANGLGSLKSSYLVDGVIDIPKNGDIINGDIVNHIGGWGYYNLPYGDRHNYGVQIYVGHLMENSIYPPDVKSSDSQHPEYMRLIGSAVTTAERCVDCGDISRFGLNWKPNLAKGKAVIRIFLVNGGSQIIAEHPDSPMILNIDSKIEGSATLSRLDFNYGLNDVCSRKYKMSGVAKNSQSPSSNLDIIIIDEYRGKVLANGNTDTSGNFNINFEINNIKGEETQFITPRAYVYINNDLIALQTNLESNIGGHLTLTNKFLNTISNCEWESNVIPQTSSPTLILSASPSLIYKGQLSILIWSSTNANSCVASNGWTGTKALSSTQNVSPTQNTTYTLTCTAISGKSITKSATITVLPNQLPIGYHDGFFGNQTKDYCKIGGWVTDPDNRSKSLEIKIYLDNLLLTIEKANLYRSDLEETGVCPDGVCAFDINIYDIISKNKPYSIKVKAKDYQTGQEVDLINTPKTMTCIGESESKNVQLIIPLVEVSSTTFNSATINWTTNKLSNSQIKYGTETGQHISQTKIDRTKSLSHSILISNLNLSTTYYYRVKSRDKDNQVIISPEYNFTTTRLCPNNCICDEETLPIECLGQEINFTEEKINEIKVSAESAIQIIRDENISGNIKKLDLKETEKEMTYEIIVSIKGKLFGLIPVEINKKIIIDPITGEIISIEKPWFYFLIHKESSIN